MNKLNTKTQLPQAIVSSRYSPIEVIIGGKKRILKNITYSTCGCKSNFEITYQINQDCFTNFYCGKHKNKLLSWIKRHKFLHEVKSIT